MVDRKQVKGIRLANNRVQLFCNLSEHLLPLKNAILILSGAQTSALLC